ncbi:MAG: HEAT repeat domain-containing protein, partial [Blastocatellia bacterium]
MSDKVRSIGFWCLLLLVATTSQAQKAESNSAVIRALPLYEQCKTLVDVSETATAAIAALKGKDQQKRIEAANTLARSCDKRATEPLLTAFREENPALRVAIVEALGKLGDQEAIDPLI